MQPRDDIGIPKLWQKVEEQSKRPPSYLISQLAPSNPIPKRKVAAKADPSTSLPKEGKEGTGSRW